jgi:hypothetical protein
MHGEVRRSALHERNDMAEPTQSVELDIALPPQVAKALDTSLGGLAQMRYRGNGPKFIKRGSRVLYRWSDVLAYLDANTVASTGDPRGAA